MPKPETLKLNPITAISDTASCSGPDAVGRSGLVTGPWALAAEAATLLSYNT